MTKTILHIDASARQTDSVSRSLSQRLADRLAAGTASITHRDLAVTALPQIDDAWIGANFTPPADRSADQQEKLALSDALVDELIVADSIVIGLPIYNFSVPASLKAWIDLIARVGRTFEYTAEGPRGLLSDKRVILAVTSGGTEVGSDIDFATGYLRHVLGFVGLTNVDLVAADRLAVDPEATLKAANLAVDNLSLAA